MSQIWGMTILKNVPSWVLLIPGVLTNGRDCDKSQFSFLSVCPFFPCPTPRGPKEKKILHPPLMWVYLLVGCAENSKDKSLVALPSPALGGRARRNPWNRGTEVCCTWEGLDMLSGSFVPMKVGAVYLTLPSPIHTVLCGRKSLCAVHSVMPIKYLSRGKDSEEWYSREEDLHEL